MKMIARNPRDGVYPTGPDYIHAMEVIAPERLLFISGTMGLDQSGVPPADLEQQLALIWSNLRRILAEAGMTTNNIARLTSYLRSSDCVVANQNARVKALNGRAIPTTAIVVETLVPEWLVEIEAIAVA
jgi:enamine deaminase RidA (YjgF/YER057c/UK114 family)